MSVSKCKFPGGVCHEIDGRTYYVDTRSHAALRRDLCRHVIGEILSVGQGVIFNVLLNEKAALRIKHLTHVINKILPGEIKISYVGKELVARHYARDCAPSRLTLATNESVITIDKSTILVQLIKARGQYQVNGVLRYVNNADFNDELRNSALNDYLVDVVRPCEACLDTTVASLGVFSRAMSIPFVPAGDFQLRQIAINAHVALALSHLVA